MRCGNELGKGWQSGKDSVSKANGMACAEPPTWDWHCHSGETPQVGTVGTVVQDMAGETTGGRITQDLVGLIKDCRLQSGQTRGLEGIQSYTQVAVKIDFKDENIRVFAGYCFNLLLILTQNSTQ